MEKIKSMLNPGKATEDEIMYGSGRSDDPIHSGNPGRLAGEGSHFNDIRETKGATDVKNTTAASDISGLDGSHKLEDTSPGHVATSGTSDLEGSRRVGDTDTSPGHVTTATATSAMPSSFPAQSNNPYSSQHVDSRIGGSTGHDLSRTDAAYDPNTQKDLTGHNPTGDNQHHYGRDVAAAGTAGALGEGIHHHRENEKDALGHESSTTTGMGPNANANEPTHTADPAVGGPHVTSTANRLDPNLNPNAAPIEDASRHSETGGGGRSADEAHGRKSHLGRDAVIGAGGIGIAEHEHRKHEHEREAGLKSNVVTTGDINDKRSVPTDKYPNESARLNEPGNDSATVPTVGSYRTATNPGHDNDTSKDHHYGRDTTAAGVVGGYEAEKHNKLDKDLSAAEREEKRELKHEKKEEKKHHGALAFPHRDKNKKYTKDEEEEFEKQERDHNRLHALDAVVGGTAYEVEKKHGHPHSSSTEEPDTMKPLPLAPGNDGLGTGQGTQNLLGLNQRGAPGGREQTRQDFGQPQVPGATRYQESPASVGDGAHGDERKRGVGDYDSPTATATGHHHGQEAAVGAGGVALAEHQHRKHEKDRPLEDNTNTTSTSKNDQHHLGRDAALGVGGVGLAEHEHRKHEKERGINEQDTSADTHKSGGILNKLGLKSGKGATENYAVDDNTTDRNLHPHHHGQEAAVGAGAAGLAEHEHRKHEKERGVNEQNTTTDTHKSGGLLSKLGLKSDKAATGMYTADDSTADPNLHSRHHGQEVAVGAGTVGLTEHEHRKHEKERPLDGNTTDTGNKHHLGRDAAVGAGGVGIVEHEHRKHEKERDTVEQESLTTHQKSGGLLSKLGLKSDKNTNGTYADDTTSDPNLHPRHHGQEAGVGAGTVGLAEHEHRKHEKERPLDGNTTDTGNKDHLGRDAAVGVGGAGLVEHEHRKHERERGISKYDDTAGAAEPHKSGGLLSKLGLKSDKTAAGTYTDDTTNSNQDRQHLGRDAALGAGGVGLAEHEHSKHERERGLKDNQNAEDVDHKHHLGRDAAIGVSGAGLVEHEHKKHEKERISDENDNLTTTHKSGGLISKLGLKSDKTSTGTYAGDTIAPNQDRQHLGRDTALGTSGVGLAEHEDWKHEREGTYDRDNVETGVGGSHIPGTGPSRNVLHKELPADHPAAAGVVRSEANTDQDGRLVESQDHGVVGAGTGTGASAYSSTGTGAYPDASTGVATRGPGTY